MKEEHLSCGDLFAFNKALENHGVKSVKKDPYYTAMFGYKVFQDNSIPANEVRLISAKGEVIKTFLITAKESQ